MPIEVECPSCTQALRVPDNLIGDLVRCPNCEMTFTAIAAPSSPSEYSEPQVQQSESLQQEQPYQPATLPRPPQPHDDFEYQQPPRRSRPDYAPHRSTLILVLGILSLAGFFILTGLPAWIMGSYDLKQMAAGRMDPEGYSNTNTGRLLGMISTLFFGLLVFPFCFCCVLGPLLNG